MTKVIEYVVWLALAYVNIVLTIRNVRDGSDYATGCFILGAALCLITAMRVASEARRDDSTTDPDHPQE